MQLLNVLCITSKLIKTWAPIFISALSVAISLYEFFSRKAKEHTKISISIDSEAGIDLFYAFVVQPGLLRCNVPCLFVNDASSDISIVRIDLILLDGTVIKCKQREESFYTYEDPNHYGPVAKSIKFPINLMKMQGTYGVLRFDIPYQNEQLLISDVLVHTNRKTICSRKFTSELNLAISKLDEQIDSHDNSKNSSSDSESPERN